MFTKSTFWVPWFNNKWHISALCSSFNFVNRSCCKRYEMAARAVAILSERTQLIADNVLIKANGPDSKHRRKVCVNSDHGSVCLLRLAATEPS